MRSHSYRDGSNRNDCNCAECACSSASLLTAARAGVNAINRIRRNGHAETTRMQDVTKPALELLVAVVAH